MIDAIHAYQNVRPDVDWNTSGQAAIATLLDFHKLDPFALSRTQDGNKYWDDGAIIDKIAAHGYGPDVDLAWGSTVGRISNALNHYGMSVWPGFSGIASAGSTDLWNSLELHLNMDRPVPVMLDLGAMGGPDWVVHWAVAYKIADGRVYLGNCSWNPNPTIDEFKDAWRCWFLPFSSNHCSVFAEPVAHGTGGWEWLGGGLSSAPGVSSWATGRLDVFVKGTDNALWHRIYENDWHDWEPLGEEPITSDPVAVSWGEGRIDVFARGADNSLMHKWYDGAWSKYVSRGGELTSAPAVSSWRYQQLDIFAGHRRQRVASPLRGQLLGVMASAA